MAQPLPVLLMTRPPDASERFAASLRARGLLFRPVISPLFAIEPRGPLPGTEGLRGLIFTSANGVACWDALGGRKDLPVYTVGPATARAARAAGMVAQGADGGVEELRDWLLALKPPVPLLHVHGTHVSGDLSGQLTRAGLQCGSVAVYDQPRLPLTPEARAAMGISEGFFRVSVGLEPIDALQATFAEGRKAAGA